MIKTKADLKYYLEKDRIALGIERKRSKIFGNDIWKFQIALRKAEYYTNVRKAGGYSFIKYYFWRFALHHYSFKLGFDIPYNVFGAGLNIHHHGCIVINAYAKVGENCNLQQGVNIGRNINSEDVPVIGNNVYIGPGAKIFGKIVIADNVVIGANAVVNKSFLEPGVVIAGVPAKIIGKRKDDLR
jgi:serine O-acetyltransferase